MPALSCLLHVWGSPQDIVGAGTQSNIQGAGRLRRRFFWLQQGKVLQSHFQEEGKGLYGLSAKLTACGCAATWLCPNMHVTESLNTCHVQVHAENGEAVALGQKLVFEAGITGPEGHALSRPAVLEGEATARAIRLASFVGVPLYVVHVMSIDAMEEVRDWLCLCHVLALPACGRLLVCGWGLNCLW